MDSRSVSATTKVFVYFVLALFTVLAIYPIFWLIIQSFKTTQEYLTSSKIAFPKVWYFDNYPYAWRMGNFSTLFGNSVFYTVISVTSIVILSMMAGFG